MTIYRNCKRGVGWGGGGGGSVALLEAERRGVRDFNAGQLESKSTDILVCCPLKLGSACLHVLCSVSRILRGKKIMNWRGVQVTVYIIITTQMKGKETFFMD